MSGTTGISALCIVGLVAIVLAAADAAYLLVDALKGWRLGTWAPRAVRSLAILLSALFADGLTAGFWLAIGQARPADWPVYIVAVGATAATVNQYLHGVWQLPNERTL